jgi:hypothetical protein
MLMGADLLTRAVSLISDTESALPEPAFSSQIELSPEDRNPRSISWIVEGVSRMSQVVLWEDGQSETELADVASGQITSEHLRIEGESSLTALVERVRSWLLDGSAG